MGIGLELGGGGGGGAAAAIESLMLNGGLILSGGAALNIAAGNVGIIGVFGLGIEIWSCAPGDAGFTGVRSPSSS